MKSPYALAATALLIFFSQNGVAAAPKDSGPKKSVGAVPTKASVEKSRTVEEIAEFARNSIVVVSHVGRDGKVDGVGSGFVVSSNGLIATSLHVIGEGRPVSVQFANGQRFDATGIHAWDRKVDLAIVKIDTTNLVALQLGDSDTLKQGTPVVALGNPHGLDHSVVAGVVSAKREIDGNEMIQIAIPIEPGNSGGPLLDMQARVHGILTLKSAVTDNLGFAMPVNALKPLLDKPNPVAMSAWLTLASLNQKEWKSLFGARWTQKAGRISVESAGKGFGGRALCLAQSEVPARPFEVTVTVKLDDEAGAAGLAFAADGADRHYGFYPSAGQMRLTRFDGPSVYSWVVLKQIATPHYRPGDWNTLRVRVEKEKILCYVNDQFVCEVEDNELLGGQCGLAKFRETKAVYKDFRVGKTVPASAVPAEVLAQVTKQVEKLPAGKFDPALVAALQPNAQASQSILAERARMLEREAKQLRKLATAVHQKAVTSELLKLMELPDDKVDLFFATLLLAKLDNAELDVEAYRRQLDQMARDLKAKLAANTDERSRLDALTSYLFRENGFHGSRSDYYNRANSYINDVLDDREGMPITLSVVFIELARRIGLESVAGVPLPSHFIVRHTPKNGEPQLIDVFDGGKLITRADAEQMVLKNTGRALREADLKPASKRLILARILRNLLGSLTREEVGENSPLRYLNLVIALDPETVSERWNRALLLLQTGDAKLAREDLLWILEKQPAGVNLERVEELLRELNRQK